MAKDNTRCPQITYIVNGSAIIGSVVVPPSEVRVYLALMKAAEWSTVAQLSSMMQEFNYSPATISSLLYRLLRKRELIDRKVIESIIFGRKIKTVVWALKTYKQPNPGE